MKRTTTWAQTDSCGSGSPDTVQRAARAHERAASFASANGDGAETSKVLAVDRPVAQTFKPTVSRPTFRRCSGDSQEFAVLEAEAKRICAGALLAADAGRGVASAETAGASCRGLGGGASWACSLGSAAWLGDAGDVVSGIAEEWWCWIFQTPFFWVYTKVYRAATLDARPLASITEKT